MDFVFCWQEGSGYPVAPYHPPTGLPEYAGRFPERNDDNLLTPRIRELLLELGLDAEHRDTQRWNPFRGMVEPGDVVLIKPNLVFHEGPRGSLATTTQAAVVRPILDYLFLLRETDGIETEVIIGDVPLQSARFDRIVEETGLGPLVQHFVEDLRFPVKLLDLRQEIAVTTSSGFVERRIQNDGDPRGYVPARLPTSFLDEIIEHRDRFSIGSYDDAATRSHHDGQDPHEYLLCRSVLASSLFVNLPKIKTHKKAGITAALKNLIGINGDKSWIPHHRLGAPASGGDEYSNEMRWLKFVNSRARRLLQGRSRFLWDSARAINRHVIKPLVGSRGGPETSAVAGGRERWSLDGSWYGNDTLWRSILDLNCALFFADAHGSLRDEPQRRYLCLGDGIVAGEGDGPLLPTPRAAGLVTLSDHPVLHDAALAALMGFAWEKVPGLARATELPAPLAWSPGSPARLRGRVGAGAFRDWVLHDLPSLDLTPPRGWRGHIERDTGQREAS